MPYIYDEETYPNIFTLTAINVDTGDCMVFEISERRDHGRELHGFLMELHYSRDTMVGFNNLNFDYPIIHDMMESGIYDYRRAYQKSQAIIFGDSFSHMVWDDQRYIEQIDLFKIHHFDNKARSTGLKTLECNMRSRSVKDLPFPPSTWLTQAQMDQLIEYNIHDVMETWRFYLKSKDRIDFRRELSDKYDRNFMNHNDTKIGKDYFIMRLNEAGIPTHVDRQPIQTIRHRIRLADVIFDSVQFRHQEFNRILNWFRSQTITETKGTFKDVTCSAYGFTYVFGLGGIHGSVESQVVVSDDEYAIIDMDVASYYPNLAIANDVYPEHLGHQFCEIYRDVYEQRRQYPKGSAENAMLKLALNGVYGDSNNQYSPFYDPQYTMTITINGQLLLCMLSEWIMSQVDGAMMIQANTDGLTVKVPRSQIPHLRWIADTWEMHTGLTLEDVEYSRMFIRDVNNYVAEYAGTGKLKRKGCYCYGDDLDWHQNHSSQIIAIAAEAAMVRGISVKDTITNHLDLWDFLINTKVPRSSKLLWGDDQVQNICRYYICKTGKPLTKLMPPLARATSDEWRRIGINVGWNTWVCNDIDDATMPIDYDWYIAEAEKLVIAP